MARTKPSLYNDDMRARAALRAEVGVATLVILFVGLLIATVAAVVYVILTRLPTVVEVAKFLLPIWLVSWALLCLVSLFNSELAYEMDRHPVTTALAGPLLLFSVLLTGRP